MGLKRSQLKRTGGPRRGGAIATNPERMRVLYLRNYHGPFAHDHSNVIVRPRPCIGLELDEPYSHYCDGAGQVAHVVPRSRGGDWSCCILMCRSLHDWFDSRSTSKGCAANAAVFLERTGVDLMAVAYGLAHDSLMLAQRRSDLDIVIKARADFEASYMGRR